MVKFGTKTVYAWIEDTGPQPGLHLAIIDESTGTPLYADYLIPGTISAVTPRLVITTTNALLLWKDHSNLNCCVVAGPGVSLTTVFTCEPTSRRNTTSFRLARPPWWPTAPAPRARPD
jgi:hypothetical protein